MSLAIPAHSQACLRSNSFKVSLMCCAKHVAPSFWFVRSIRRSADSTDQPSRPKLIEGNASISATTMNSMTTKGTQPLNLNGYIFANLEFACIARIVVPCFFTFLLFYPEGYATCTNKITSLKLCCKFFLCFIYHYIFYNL